MRQESTVVEVRTQGRGLVSFHRKVEDWVRQIGATRGLLTLLIQHTSASLLLQENADPDVQTSLSIPVAGGRLALGTWQGLYVFEHRLRGHARKVALHFIGE
jgi:thiamine phosphate synthase YjbQ (UPF0047 family)